MSKLLPVCAVSFGVVGAIALVAGAGPRGGAGDRGEAKAVTVTTAAPVPPGDRDLVVVELFTSQGCSSCPPADAYLRQLGARGDVLPLSFHVDYWNYIGWSDPFSSPRWSQRQQAYARSRDFRTYTPQLVVNGRTDAVGSQRGEVDRAIAAAARRQAADHKRTPISLQATARRAGTRVVVDVKADGPAGQVVAVVFENGLATKVSRGENSGNRLANDYVVRGLARGFDISRKKSGRVTVNLDAAPMGTLGVAVFVQDPKNLAIRAARAVAL